MLSLQCLSPQVHKWAEKEPGGLAQKAACRERGAAPMPTG